MKKAHCDHRYRISFCIPLRARDLLQNLAQAASHNHLLARLEHPDSHYDRIYVRRYAGGSAGRPSRLGVELDARSSTAELRHDVAGRNLQFFLAVANEQMWNVIRHWRNGNLRLEAGETL